MINAETQVATQVATLERPKLQGSIEQLIRQALEARQRLTIIGNEPFSLDLPQTIPESTIQEYLSNTNICERPKNAERVWVLTQEEANELIQKFNQWNLSRQGLITAQTSFSSGVNISDQAIVDSFGQSDQYLDYYRRNRI